jgi:hypothetical protein
MEQTFVSDAGFFFHGLPPSTVLVFGYNDYHPFLTRFEGLFQKRQRTQAHCPQINRSEFFSKKWKAYRIDTVRHPSQQKFDR